MNQFDLSGRAAIVTGGAKGLGLAVAKRFLASGARVALWDHDAQALEQCELGSDQEVLRLGVDVSDVASVENAFEKTMAAFDQVDILVNSAGIAGPIENVWDYPIADWRQVIDVNLMGVYHCCRTVVPAMRAAGYGRIINVASIAGKEGNPLSSAYSVSKAGVIALTKSLGKELVSDGVLVNAVAPAAFATEMVRNTKKEHMEYMLSKIPLGRLGSPEEFGALVAWLASAESSFSTGAVFDISGGRATY